MTRPLRSQHWEKSEKQIHPGCNRGRRGQRKVVLERSLALTVGRIWKLLAWRMLRVSGQGVKVILCLYACGGRCPLIEIMMLKMPEVVVV